MDSREYQEARSFLKTDHGANSTLPVIYKSNKKAWMNSGIWKEYLEWLDDQVKPRKVLLLVDNFSGHGKKEDKKLRGQPKGLRVVLQERNARKVARAI
jgi:hypothetical protein